MRVGICTRYRQHEATHVAIRLARWAGSGGLDVSLFSDDQPTAKLSPYWDKIVKRTTGVKFTDWASFMDVIIWTHCPPPEHLIWSRQKGARTIIVPLWHEFTPDHRHAYREVSHVLCPSKEAADFITRRGGAGNVRGVAWDPGFPLTPKIVRLPPRRSLLLPLFDGDLHRMEGTILDVLGRILAEFEDVELTVAYNTSTIAPFASKRVKQYARRFPGRVHTIRSIHPRHRPILYCRHDLTIWPVDRVDAGLVALSSISAGTPVIYFNTPPVGELITKCNGISVPCNLRQLGNGVPVADPDYAAFYDRLRECLDHPNWLPELHRVALHGLGHRRRLFDEVVRRVVTP